MAKKNIKNKAFDQSKYALWIDPQQAIPYERNAKEHTEKQIKNIANSIRRFGWQQDTVLTTDNVLVIGHGRRLAAIQLGCMMPYHVIDKTADELTDEDIRELRIADNQTNAETGLDLELLGAEIEDLDFDGFDFDFGIDFDEPQEIIEDDVPEVPEEPRTKLGDVYMLGQHHRLICGDSTDPAVIDRLMDGVKADMVFTDPPYGMKKEKDGVLNDNLNFDDLLDFNRQWIPLTFGALKDNGSWYCWGIDEPLMDIYSNILKPMQKNKQIAFRNLITWDKGNGQGQLSEDFRMYPIADEKCLFVMVGGDSVQGFSVNQEDYSENMDKVRLYLESEIAKLNQSDKTIANALGYKDGRTVNHWRSKSQFALPTRENYEALREYGRAVLKDYDFLKKDYDELKKDYDELKKDYDELKKDYDELKKDFYEGRSYFNNTHDNMNNVWHFDRAGKDEREHTGGHATPKPIALCSRAIKSSSREGEIVLDVFGGSGSTLIACEQLNRKCYMAEISPEYCDVILARWEAFTGEKAVLLSGE